MKWFASLTPEELKSWDDASDSFKLTILRREVDSLNLVTMALVWLITACALLFAGSGFFVFWFVRRS